MKKITLLILTMIVSYGLTAQVAVNNDGTNPDTSAMLDVKSTDKGMLVPRMTAAERNGISNPATGLLVFCTDNNQYYTNKGTPVVPIWMMISTQWLSNSTNIYFDSGNVGIGTSNPNQSAILELNASDKGFLLPRLSVDEIAAISTPADGLQVYNTTDGELYIYVAILGSWRQLDYGMHSLSTDCGFPITDARDSQTYNTVLIGDQCWMSENLNVGDRVDGQYDQFNDGDIEKYCYDDDTQNCDTYGGLYQWAEMVQYLNGASNTVSWNPVLTGSVQGICPSGWHIPTDDEWKTLEMNLGMSQTDADATYWRGTDEGGKLKEAGTTH